MVRTAWSVLGRYGGSEADDVVQEAFIAALTTPALPRGGDVGAWLRAITARKALDWVRRSTRRRERPLPEAADVFVQASSAIDVMTLRAVLARLTPIDKAILVLADLEGRSMGEVAELLGLTRVAVKLRASRARRKLSRMLEADEGGRNDE
jgi:RNA polymerase sigma-70 factor (ECF subfamily)